MGWLALLLVGVAGWLVWTGRLQRMRARDGMAIGLALVGAVLAAKGKPVIGVPLLTSAVGYVLLRTRIRPRTKKLQPEALPTPADVAQARALLGLGPESDADAVRAAHRRLIAAVHPDRGGTEALAAQINAARDLLLRTQPERRSGEQ